MFLVKSSATSHVCPLCKGMMKYRDSRKRIWKKEGGVKENLVIRRFRCEDCHSYHNELPDCLVPYKHYDAEVIAGVLDGPKLPIGKNGAKVQTYLSSAIDDHSRYLLHSQFYDNQEEAIIEDTFHTMTVIVTLK